MGKAKAAPAATPRGGNKSKAKSEPEAPKSDFEQSMYQRNLFLVMVMDMTWRLAIVVLVPIIGGYYLDQYFHTFPGLMIAGFFLAALGVVGTMISIINKAGKKAGFKK